jgi:L-fuconate dehydratase
MFDAVALTGDLDTRCIEFVDHLHEHFVTPVDVHDGRYWPPTAPGAGTEMHAATLDDHAFPDGPVWAAVDASVPDAVRVA